MVPSIISFEKFNMEHIHGYTFSGYNIRGEIVEWAVIAQRGKKISKEDQDKVKDNFSRFLANPEGPEKKYFTRKEPPKLELTYEI